MSRHFERKATKASSKKSKIVKGQGVVSKRVDNVEGEDNEDEPIVARSERIMKDKENSRCAKSSKKATKSAVVDKGKHKGKSKMLHEGDKKFGKNSKVKFSRIRHRSQPSFIAHAAKEMTKVQREAVSKIAFDKLLDLQCIDIPSRLCLWIVHNYDARRGQLTLTDGTKLEVTERDVEICLGLPRGGKEIVKMSTMDNKYNVNKWREHIGKDSHSIRPSIVYDVMFGKKDKDDNDGVVDMRLLLVYSCIIEPHMSGVVNQNLVFPLNVIDDLGSYNWCGFIISCLNEAKEKWLKNHEASFTVPLLFMRIHYLDRVVNYGKRDIEPRNVSPLISWSDELINKREKMEIAHGGFGMGLVDAQQIIPTEEEDDN